VGRELWGALGMQSVERSHAYGVVVCGDCFGRKEVKVRKKAAEVNARAVYGATPLHVAASKKDVQIGRVLLSYGADATLECNGRWVSEQFLQSLQQE